LRKVLIILEEFREHTQIHKEKPKDVNMYLGALEKTSRILADYVQKSHGTLEVLNYMGGGKCTK
jgi:hypothetical protein